MGESHRQAFPPSGADGADGLTRRDVVRRSAVVGAGLMLPATLAACGGDSDSGATAGGDGGGATATSGAAPSSGRRGGRLRVAVASGAAATLYPWANLVLFGTAHNAVTYDTLTRFDKDGRPILSLADAVEPNADGSVWTIKLKRGVTLHDGSEFGARDVVFSFHQLLDPRSPSEGIGFFPNLKPGRVRAKGAYEVELDFGTPTASMMSRLAQSAVRMVKADHLDFKAPIGTGPFKLAKFVPGQLNVYERNADYWQEGKPYVDTLELYPIAEADTRVNALLSGQVDAIVTTPPAQVKSLESQGFKIAQSSGSDWFPLVMPLNREPFDDANVRRAMRLLIDRQQVVDNVYGGYGRIGNDLFSPFDPAYADDLPQHGHDPEQARSLLRRAGREGLEVTLYVADYDPQVLPIATLLAEGGKDAGVTVNLSRSNAASYFEDVWTKKPFFFSQWSGRSLLEQMLFCVGANAPTNETAYDDPKFTAILSEASRTIDDDARAELLGELQRRLHDDGGYIIPGFADYVDAHAEHVTGLATSPYGPLGFFDFNETSVG